MPDFGLSQTRAAVQLGVNPGGTVALPQKVAPFISLHSFQQLERLWMRTMLKLSEVGNQSYDKGLVRREQ
jgi:hypothetical protein